MVGAMRRAGTILVADRNPKFVEKTQEILSEAGYQVIPALDGDGARDALRAPLDGVLVHAALPGTSGFALCRMIKERDPALPVVLMFSLEDEAGAEEAHRAGADNYLIRPLKRSEVLFVARDLVAQREALLRATRLSEERDAARRSGSDGTIDGNRLLQFELFKRVLSIELKRSRRYGFPLSLLVATLDEPAQPSDRDGLAVAVRGAIRDIDIPVAFGSNDVLVVMPHTDLEGAKLVAERIRKRVRSTGRQPFTASVGVVAADGSDRLTFSTLLAQATRARKQAAREGGDRVVAA
jgi:PleD family two-component response regulator